MKRLISVTIEKSLNSEIKSLETCIKKWKTLEKNYKFSFKDEIQESEEIISFIKKVLAEGVVND